MATKKKSPDQGALLVEDAPTAIPPSVTTPNRLRLHRLTVEGFAGIEGEQVIDFDREVTIISGRNASNKSSLLAALRSVLGIDRQAAARRAHILPDGSTSKPRIEVVLLGTDREIHIRRVADGSPEVREKNGEDWRIVPRPVEWLRDLIDVHGANPQLFLQAKDEDKAAMILEALDLPEYSRAAALREAGMESFRLPAIPEGLHPLEDLERVVDAIRTGRTEVGAQEKLERATATKLVADLPAAAPKDVAEQVKLGEGVTANLATAIAQEMEVVASKHREAEAAIKATFDRERTRLETALQVEAARLRAAAEARVAELSAERDTAIDAARTAGEAELSHADVARDLALKSINSKKATLAEGREKLAAYRAQQGGVETDRKVRGLAMEARQKADGHKKRYDELTAGIEGLNRYRLKLAGALPIKGLEVTFTDKGKAVITLDRVPIEEVNDGRLARLSNEVSALRARPAGDRPYLALILMDWLERIDEGARATHLRALAAGGAQIVAAVVDATPLEVRKGEAALGQGSA